MQHPTDRIAHTTAFVTPVVEHWLEREIAQWVHPMKDRSDDPSHHERTLLPRSYISLLSLKVSLTSICLTNCMSASYRTMYLGCTSRRVRLNPWGSEQPCRGWRIVTGSGNTPKYTSCDDSGKSHSISEA